MADFAEKAREWKRINTAAELAPLLHNVKPRRYRNYQYTADAPCHPSGSKASFQFGDHPQGGLAVSCWACSGQGEKGWYDRLENILGAALQIRKPDGTLRYREPGAPKPAPAPQPQPDRRPPALYRQDATLQDLKETPIWIAARNKAPWQGLALENGRLLAQAYRQSMDDQDAPDGNGLKLARNGGIAAILQPSGEKAPARIRPWGTLRQIQEFISGLKPAKDTARPALALAGNASMPHPIALLIIDCDYHPEDDPDEAGKAARLELERLCAAEGAPVFGSSGGHGFHALFLLAPETGPPSPRQRRLDAHGAPGASAEIFLSGSRRMLALRLDKPLANAAGGQPLPAVTAEQAGKLAAAALGKPKRRRAGRENGN